MLKNEMAKKKKKKSSYAMYWMIQGTVSLSQVIITGERLYIIGKQYFLARMNYFEKIF